MGCRKEHLIVLKNREKDVDVICQFGKALAFEEEKALTVRTAGVLLLDLVEAAWALWREPNVIAK